MTRRILPGLILVAVFLAAACSPSPAGVIPQKSATPVPATATPPPQPTTAPKPRLGKVAFVKGGDIWVKGLPDEEAKRLTQDGHNSTPRWSPSGDWLTFQKDDRTAWVMRPGGTDSHQVQPGLKVQLDWLPRSDRLAYSSNGGIYVIGPDGSGKRELVPPGKEPGAPGVGSFTWSQDGQWLAFETTKLETGTGSANNPPKITAQSVYRVMADGTSLTEVYRNPDPSKPFRLVDWSPDGQYLLAWQDEFFPSNSGAADGWPLFALPLAGGAPIKISERVLLSRDFLSWAPAGHTLALVDGGNRSTWYGKHLATSDLSGLAQLRSDPSRADLFPAWSPDGGSIAYTSAPAVQTDGGDVAKQAAAERKIWIARPDGSGKRQLTNDANYRDERPEWSRDGTHILFGRFQGDRMELWLMRPDGSELRQVVGELSPAPGPASAWFGYYGYVGWSGLYDWWVGPPPARQLPASPSS